MVFVVGHEKGEREEVVHLCALCGSARWRPNHTARMGGLRNHHKSLGCSATRARRTARRSRAASGFAACSIRSRSARANSATACCASGPGTARVWRSATRGALPCRRSRHRMGARGRTVECFCCADRGGRRLWALLCAPCRARMVDFAPPVFASSLVLLALQHATIYGSVSPATRRPAAPRLSRFVQLVSKLLLRVHAGWQAVRAR
jgi:hypothetical protein